MSNTEIYNNIVKLYPNFSLKALFLRYKSWNTYVEEHIISDAARTLYDSLKGLKFSVFHAPEEDFEFTIEEEDLITWKELFPEGHYDDLELTVSGEHSDLQDALFQMLLDQSKPSVIKPTFNHAGCTTFTFTQQPKATGLKYKEKYVNRILELDPDFSMQVLYDNIVKQGEVAKKLPGEYMVRLASNVDNIKDINLFHKSGNLTVTDLEDEDLIVVENATEDQFNQFVANLYDGTNHTLASYKDDGTISLDTYPESFGWV